MRAVAFLFVAIASPLFAAPAHAAGPVCALLDPEKHPRAALLEAKLLSDNSATWVERADIDKVLKEQKLQALFSPQGVGERVQLGKLLKADLLVMIRPVKGAETPTLEVVVSETASGLRLMHRAVPITKNTDEDIAALLAAAKDGIKRHDEKITEIVAVPPFVSNDLGYEFAHLKGAYAKLAEGIALERAGVVVVELAEAEALAKELRLAASGSVLANRPPPVYVLGEYRHEGKGKERTVTIKLRAERAGKAVGKPQTQMLTPNEAPGAIRKWAANTLDPTGVAAAAPADGKTEAKRLGQLASVHRRLGNWPEAMALIEASLLLDPKQLELHVDAIEVLPQWINELVRPNPRDLNRLRQSAELHRRGLNHLEILVTSGEKLARYTPSTTKRVSPRQFASAATRPIGGPLPAMMAEIVQPLREEEIALYEKLVVLVAKQGNLEEELYYAQRVSVYAMQPAEAYARFEKTLLVLKDLPNAKERMHAHLFSPPYLPRGPMFAEHRKFLDRLEASGNEDIKAAVVEVRPYVAELERLEKNQAARFEREKAARAAFDEAKKTNPKLGMPLTFADPERVDAELRGSPFKHIRLTATPAEPEPRLSPEHEFPRMGQIQGILPAGTGIDVVWTDGDFSDGTLYVMKEKGKLKRVFRVGGLRSRFTSIVFDGKYVWAAGDRLGLPPVLVVLDPSTERVLSITERHGLPLGKKEPHPRKDERVPGPHIVALEPGRVCIAGWFGQTWIALGTFDPKTGPKLKIIHEAREVGDGKPDEWRKTTIAFYSEQMFTLRGKPDADGKCPVRVLFVRGQMNNPNGAHPLLIDPDAETAEVMQQAIPGPMAYPMCGTGSSMFVAWGMGYQFGVRKQSRLLRIDYPGKVTDLGELPPARGKPAIHFDGKQLHIVRIAPELLPWQTLVPVEQRWWPKGDPSDWSVIDVDKKRNTRAAADFHRVKWIGTSSHYGLVAVLDCRTQTLLCSVTLAK